MKKRNWFTMVAAVFFIGCASNEIKPVDLFPEDQCAQCRMTVSNDAFASEIITNEGEVLKFDDLGCLEQFVKSRDELVAAAIFVKDYDSRTWLTKEQSFIVRTSLKTPMGSGNVAFADSLKAKQLIQLYPPQEGRASEAAICSCCNIKGK